MERLQYKTSYASDEEIIQKVVSGETALFEVLIRRYNPLLYKIARSYGFLHHDAEDLLQESHFAAYTQLKTFRKEASFKTWLTKIHLHKCYHKLHRDIRQAGSISPETIPEDLSSIHAAAGKQGPEKTMINKELAKVLEEGLQQLPLIYRSVFVLREIEGFSVAETAQLLTITPVNVKVRLNRAKALLQKQVEQYYSAADIYDFHLKYCDKIVQHVFARMETGGNG